MGIDVYDVRLTEMPNDESDCFTFKEDEWDNFCNIPIEVYAKYIREIPQFDF